MNFRVLKNGKHPVTKKPIKKGTIIDVWHETGLSLWEGKDPLLARTVKVDSNTALAMKLETDKEIGK